MYHSEVQDWLISIGLQNLYQYFVEDGFTNLETVRNMRQSDIDAIVDRHGYMITLNEEIDRLNYGPSSSNQLNNNYNNNNTNTNENNYEINSTSNSSYDYEPIQNIMKRYQVSSVPSVGFVSQHLARRSKSKTNKLRGSSALPFGYSLNYKESSIGRYVPNSASDEFEAFWLSNIRSRSIAPLPQLPLPPKRESTVEHFSNLEEKINQKERSNRAKSEMHYSDVPTDKLDRSRFRDHYTNEYVWVEKNHITDVGVKYDGLSRKVDHKPSHWRCEDEIERGKEYKRMNDEYADRIADNRQSIDNSRDWLTNDGGVIDRVHRMSAQTQKTRYDLDSIKRNMDNIRAMRTRLLKQ